MDFLASLPPWSLIEEILRTLVLPTFVAASVVFAVVCALSRSERWRAIGAVVALIAGLAAGNHFHPLAQWWPSPFLRGWRCLLPVISGVATAAALLTLLPGRILWIGGLAARLCLAASGTWLLVEALSPLSEAWTYGVVLVGVVLNWEACRLILPGIPSRTAFVILTTVWGGASAALLIFAHSARFSDLAVLLTTSLCGVGLVALLRKLEVTFLLAVPAVFYPCLLLAGAANTYSEIPVSAFACVAFAPLGLLVLLVPQIQRLPLRVLMTIAAAALLIPCAIGVGMAAQVESLDYGE